MFLITHDASGGGSTVVLVVLYELRERYQCIVVKQFSDFLHEGLQFVYQKSRLPFVILIDDFQLSHTDRTLFLRQLENNEIKAQVILTERKTLDNMPSAMPAHNSQQHHVSSDLCKEDAAAFKVLYMRHKRKMPYWGRVFLYGLFAFLGDTDRVSFQIQFVSENTMTDQKLLLTLCSMVWKYDSFAIPKTTAMKILNKSPDDMIDENLSVTLGYASDLLVPNGDGLKAAHTCIIQPLMDAQCEKLDDMQKSHLLQFCKNIREMITKCGDDTKTAGDECYHVIIIRTADYSINGPN